MDLNKLNKDQLLEIATAVDALDKKFKYNKAKTYFPDKGKYSRDKYPKQMELMRAGKKHRLRALVGGNGSGKSLWLALESYYHMSGKYPAWWEGHKFTGPITAWLCGLDAKALRAGLQEILFGGIGDDDFGTGVIARDDMTDDSGHLQKWAMQGTANCIGQFRVRHYTNGVFDGWSTCEFMSYEQGWKSFQGPTKNWIGFDEEPEDGKIFGECVARLRGKDGAKPGHFLATFTPTDGFRDVYLTFVPQGIFPEDGLHVDDPSKYTARIGWSNSPHLDEEWKASAIKQWELTDPENIQARTEGFAAAGSGRIFPTPESDIVVPKMEIPSYWKRCYGMDPGQKNFGGCWIAQDPDTNIYYVYDEYKTQRHVLYLIHAEAFRARGKWLQGGIDPHEACKPRDTGETVQSYFQTQGLNLTAASGDELAWLMKIRAWFESGQLKIMDNCTQILSEYRTYHYDSNNPNKPAKNQQDHILDAMRYCLTVFDSVAESKAEYEESQEQSDDDDQFDTGRSSVTGY
jgi:phage terminase large subunit-like protein